MTLQSYYLKFTDEAQASAVLFPDTPTAWDDEGNVIATEPRQTYANTSIIGTIYKPTDETDAEGNAVMEAIEGWHVNVLADAPELSIYQVFPAVPMRVWG